MDFYLQGVMAIKFTAKKGKKLVIKIAIFSVVAYIIFLFINQQVKIKRKKDELFNLNEQIKIEKAKKEEIKNSLEENSAENNYNGSKTRIFENVTE